MNSYELSRKWFDWSFENPELISPNHSALYFFAIEHCNRLGWRKKFGFPTEMAKDAIGIKSYKTYINTLNDLVSWGFIEMVERSKNQYSANIIALVEFTEALDKALDKAMLKHVSKQDESTCQSTDESIVSIDKHINIKPIEQITNNNNAIANILKSSESESWLTIIAMQNGKDSEWVKSKLDEFIIFLLTQMKIHKSKSEFISHFTNWLPKKMEGIKIEAARLNNASPTKRRVIS